MVLLLYLAAWIFMNESLLSIVLYIIIPFVFVLSIISCGNPFRNNRYLTQLLVLYAWIGLTYVGAMYVIEAKTQMKQIIGVILLCSVFANLAKNKKLIPWLYGVYIVYYIGILRFAQQTILNEITIFEERLDGEGMNANMLAYFTFYATMAIYMLGECINKWPYVRRVFRLLFIATIALSFFVAMLTASRQVMILQTPLYLILMYARYATKSFKGFLLILVVTVCLILSYSDLIIHLYDGSLLQERNQMSIEDDERTLVIKEAVKYGFENPLFGLGPGNFVKYSSYNVFSHCTYTELFANSGLFAVLIYVILLFRFIWTQWLRYIRSKQIPYLIFCIFGVFFVVDNFFYVFYNGLWLMGFFVLVATHSETYYHQDKTLIRP